MTRTIHIEFNASNQIFDPKLMSADDPDRTKLLAAIALLKKAEKCELKAKDLHRQAVAAIMPLELSIEDGSLLDLPSDILFTDDNSDVTLWVEADGELGMHYSVRASCAIDGDASEDDAEDYTSTEVWGHVGINFAQDGYDCTDACDVSASITDDDE